MQTEDEGRENQTTLFAYESGVAPSAEQVEIAKSLGCTESQILAMQEEGMSSDDWARIVPAEAMLRHLKAKYPGVSFEARWVTVPSLLDSSYTLGCSARPSSGGVKDDCEVEVWQDGKGAVRYVENYFCIARKGEYQSMVEAKVDDLAQANGVPREALAVEARLVGSYDEAFDTQTDLQGNLSAMYGTIHLYVSNASMLDENAYQAFVDAVVQTLKSQGFCGDYQADYLCAFPEGSAFDADNAAWMIARSTDEEPTFKWHRGGLLGQAGE